MAVGVEAEVATTDDDGPGRRMPESGAADVRAIDGMQVRLFPKQTELYKVSMPFRHWIRAHAADYDVVHVHALFSFCSVVAARAARRARVPYIVRPLGVLRAYGLARRRPWLKRVSLRFVEGPLLGSAAAVHFTSDEERMDARKLVPPDRAVVIPIGIDLSAGTTGPGRGARVARERAAPRILFIGRLDPVKNVESLIDAVPAILARLPGATLWIGGSGDASYVSNLHRRSDELGVKAAVRWLGHVQGEAKAELLAEADLFVLPSHSENFGVAAAEALAAGVPCVLGKGVGIARQVAAAGAGASVEATPAGIAEGILGMLTNASRPRSASAAARRLAETEFSSRRMGIELASLYERVVAEQRARRA